MSCVNDFDRIWNVGRKLNITYCIGPFQDEALRNIIESNLPGAIAQMERAADVNYIKLDFGSPERCQVAWKNNQALYIVRQMVECPINDDDTSVPTTGDSDPFNNCDCGVGSPNPSKCPRAFATFPAIDSGLPSTRKRRVVFSTRVADLPNGLSPKGPVHVIVHELGHTLGLEHEHVRWEQNSLTDDNAKLCKPNEKNLPWRAVTPPDPMSIMGYPECDDIVDKVLPRLSSGDRLGLHFLYTLPRTGPLRFDAGLTDDILWIDPLAAGQSNAASVWFGGSDGLGNIVFNKQSFALPLNISRRVKPIPVRITDEPLSHVLLHAPGNSTDDPDGGPQFDSILAPSPGNSPPFLSTTYGMEQPERYAFPLVGRFLGAETDEVWWVLPGPDGTREDEMWVFDPATQTTDVSNAYNMTFSADNYRRPLIGGFVPGFGSGQPDSQVLWWHEPSSLNRFQLLAQNDNLNGPVGMSNSLSGCFVLPDQEHIPMVANFDSDPELEIFWINPRSSKHVMWWDLETIWGSGCTLANRTVLQFSTPDLFKPFLGRFNRDRTNDIFWYRGGQPPQGTEPEQVWYFNDDQSKGFESLEFPGGVGGDFSPYAGDFDGDGCEDVLWFAPHQLLSPLWRAHCNLPAFPPEGFDTLQNSQLHPPGSYPVGYLRTRGRE